MQLHYPDSIDDIELSNWDFWRKSPEEREGAFALLRKECPVAFFEEGETSVPVQGAGWRSSRTRMALMSLGARMSISDLARAPTSA